MGMKGPGATRGQGDVTGDGFVNSADFNVLAGDFGCNANIPPTARGARFRFR